MPTYARVPRFDKDFAGLTHDEQAAFRLAVANKGLRVKGVQGSPGIFEMTWGDDGRATFQYGPSQLPGEAHVIWRRVGTHAIFSSP
jgi:hypothetical protein